ncbi:MAG: glycerol-3-phosphate acyltransferase [Actinomycetota bacterium]|nr:glycerol-3-phosphate acyltransferase [Actinomycetota bacterium]
METSEFIRNIGLIMLCYLIGAVPFCNIISKIHSDKDLRKIGDKNPGGWNLVFNISKYWGAVGITLDILKGFLPSFIILRITGSELTAILAGCAAVAGHNFSPYMKLSGGKGLAATLGFFLAINPFTILAFGAGMLLSLFSIKNMIWSVISAIVFSSVFLWLLKDSSLFLIMGLLLLIIIIPKYINHSITLAHNFKFRKEKTLKDLFTPKIR